MNKKITYFDKEKGKKKKPEKKKSKARQVNEKEDENQGKDAEDDVKDAIISKDAAKNQKNKVPRSLAQLEVRIMIGLKLFKLQMPLGEVCLH